jgi:subtilisin family serine protease
MHPSLGGCFGPGCKVAFGYDLVGDKFLTDGAIPDDDPMDCLGHGTHVAGIIGASNDPDILGVAPAATLAAYRVVGCDDYSTNDVLIVAYTMAHNAGVDIISASLGFVHGWADE